MDFLIVGGIITISYACGEFYYYYLTDEFFIVDIYRSLIGR